jgi:hypothetical protein
VGVLAMDESNVESPTESLAVHSDIVTKQSGNSFYPTVDDESVVPFAEVTALDFDLGCVETAVVLPPELVEVTMSGDENPLGIEEDVNNSHSVVPQSSFHSTLSHHPTTLTEPTSSFSSHVSEELITRENSLTTEQEVVQIDEDFDASTACGLDQDPIDSKEFVRMKNYCWFVVGCSFTMFLMGSIGVILILFDAIPFSRNQSPTISISPSSILPLPPDDGSNPFDAAPSSAPSPTFVSSAPSEMPSCNGLYEKVSSITVSPSGSDKFTMSNDGRTIVVANYDASKGMSYLETFHVFASHVSQVTSKEGYFLTELQISADGSTLVIGTHTYLQEDSTQTAGTVLVMESVELNGQRNWEVWHKVVTNDGKRGAVLRVAVSDDGSTIAFFAKDSRDTYYVEVHKVDDEQEKLSILGSRIRKSFFDENTLISISGDGLRLFVTSGENQVRSFDYINGKGWLQFATAMKYDGISPKSYSSFDGNIVALSSSFGFPTVLFEALKSEAIEQWNKIGVFDVTAISQSQYIAISADGRNLIVADVLSTQKSLARLYRKSGSLYTQLQDLTLPNGIFRGIQLDETGEQLAVAIDNDVTVYRKDCPS